MKIIIIPFVWMKNINGGGETYLFRLCQWLIEQGHEVKCIAYVPEEYEHSGIRVYPQHDMIDLWVTNNDLFAWCDLVICQLLGCSYGYNKAVQHKKPLVWIAHNTYTGSPQESKPDAHVIYNAEATKQALQFEQNSIVLHPPINYRLFNVAPENGRKYVTLINCNEDKGGNVLIQLATQLPSVQFLGIEGKYGNQVTDESLFNLRYKHWSDNISHILSETKILIMPSKRESYGQTATEAACMGIPVICSDLPGLRENLGDAGIYTDDFKTEIEKLLNNNELYNEQSAKVLARAKELDPIRELKAVEIWLQKIIE